MSMTPQELSALLAEKGEKTYRAGQIYNWIHVRHAASWDEMTNLPKNLRAVLSEELPLAPPEIRALQISKLDGTRKDRKSVV